ncbi:MAG TPA: SCO family protein [Methylomirabilota bacterium]|jgi:protein SCO1/2|nr:SCO family protein [Methylomirabilota bacterium]
MANRSTACGLRVRLTALAAAAIELVTIPAVAAAAPPPAGELAPNFALTTQQNERVWLAQLRGRAVVLAFGCTRCGTCPGLMATLADIARGLGDAPGRQVFFAMVTVDPAHDTPTALREFGRANGLRASAWLLLTEDRPGEVDAVTHRYRVEVRRAGERVETDCVVTVIDEQGAIRGRYGPGASGRLAADLRALLGLPASP